MNRVVVTGMGVISPIGNHLEDFTHSLRHTVVGIGSLTKVVVEDCPIKVAAEVKNYNPEADITKKDIRRMDLFSQYALSATAQAVRHSGLDMEQINKKRLGVMIGTGIGGMETFENEIVAMHEKGGLRIAPLFVPMMIGNIASGNVAIAYGAKGICTNVVTACASATNAIGEAFRNIKHGYSDVIITGGTEASITRGAVAGFNALKALTRAEDPLRASIPFDQERSGFVIGEGSGVLILESYQHATARGANILAEIVGYGTTCDAFHMTAPSPTGEGAATAMTLAMEEADIAPSAVGYINAHGTSTQLNDAAETLAIKQAFGNYAKDVPISSTKSITGHLLGAAGAIEAMACIVAMNEGFIPATAGYTTPDPECDLNYTPNQTITQDVEYAMSNSLGFGGHNASILIRKGDPT